VRRTDGILALAGGTSLVVGFAPAPLPRLLFNASGSAPLGFYWLDPMAVPRSGDFVAAMPPPALAEFMAGRAYLPRGVFLLKRLYGAKGDMVCRQADEVTLNGRVMARALAVDRLARSLPAWVGCLRLGENDVVLFLPHPQSFDTRYFGLLKRRDLRGVVTPLWTWPGDTAAGRP
jgi:conjugative transfer signal peptidase TraF